MTNPEKKKKPTFLFNYYQKHIHVIDFNDIKAFLAIIIIMGLKKYSKQDDHWSTDILYIDPKVSGIMPKHMFKTFKCAFHIDDDSLFKSETFGKLHTIINVLNLKFYVLDQQITIDETIIPFRGSAGFIYYIPTKPTKIGIKMYSLCESSTGYCYSFKLDGGKKDKKPDFINNLVCEFVSGLEKKGYILFTDSWYSNPELFEILSKNQIAATGMIRKNRTNFIKKFVLQLTKECESACKNDVNCVLWKDKTKKRERIIKLISTIHSSEMKMLEISKGKPKVLPEILKEYQENMKGVDIMNSAIHYYKFGHRSYKWWEPIFYELLEIVINNSLIIYNKITNKKISPQEFREKVIEGLLRGWSCHLPLKKTLIMQYNPKLMPTLPAINICYLHSIIRTQHEDQDCVFCSSRNNRKRTIYGCADCSGNPHLCPECFLEYHKAHIYK